MSYLRDLSILGVGNGKIFPRMMETKHTERCRTWRTFQIPTQTIPEQTNAQGNILKLVLYINYTLRPTMRSFSAI